MLFVAKLLAAERRRRGTPKDSRALTCFWETVLALRWFRDRTSPSALAVITASPAPLATGMWTRSSRSSPNRPLTCAKRWNGPKTPDSRT